MKGVHAVEIPNVAEFTSLELFRNKLFFED
jgi:hypothetical protein